MGQKFYLESVDIKCTYFKVRRWNFKTVFFNDTPMMIYCRLYPQNLKVLLGVSRLPLLRTLSGEDLASVIARYERKKLFSL